MTEPTSSPSETTPIVTPPPKPSAAKKSGGKVVKSLHIHQDCPTTAVDCWTTFYAIRSSQNPGFADARKHFILPYWFVFSHLYNFPKLLPLAVARPRFLDQPAEVDCSEHPAFKLVFCPLGLDFSIKNITMVPRFDKKSFLSNATKFFKDQF
jgi:hypothetical protein